jgi:hypothetical protein
MRFEGGVTQGTHRQLAAVHEVGMTGSWQRENTALQIAFEGSEV